MEVLKSITKKHNKLINFVLLGLVLLMTILPLVVSKGASFSGADGIAQEVIIEQNKGYEPWFKPIYEPASGEIASLLFSLQAAIGSGVVFYIFGYWQGKRTSDKTKKETK